jgi:hypothetical protein
MRKQKSKSELFLREEIRILLFRISYLHFIIPTPFAFDSSGQAQYPLQASGACRCSGYAFFFSSNSFAYSSRKLFTAGSFVTPRCGQGHAWAIPVAQKTEGYLGGDQKV